MGYSGVSIPIVLGEVGLVTDAAPSAVPINALSKANNITFQNGRVSKQLGCSKLNSTALSSDVVGLIDWWPTSALQRTIALTDDGKMFRDTGDGTFTTQTAITTGLGAITTDSKMITAGQEYAGRSRKLFTFTNGVNQIKILTADGTTNTNIALPSADWATGNYPTFGVRYQNRVCVMGGASNKHQLYFSTINDHENFVGTTFGDARFEVWQRIAATPNVDITAAIQAGTSTTIFTLTNNDGIIVYGVNTFNRITFVVSQIETGTPVYTYEYWNGSAWTAMPLTTTPVFTAAATVFAQFTSIPSAWVVGDGTEGGGNNAYYAIRILATTAPTQAVKVTDIIVSNTSYDIAPPTFSVFPGEGDGLLSAYVYRGLLFLFKKPFGVYVLDGRDPSSANWTVSRYSDAFGVSSPHSLLQILGDLVAGNSNGSITSLEASQNFGDFDAGDILQNAKVEEYIRAQFSFVGLPYSQAVYYPEKKIALFTGQSSSTLVRDRILAIDVARQNPRISIITKDSPNCLTLRKDSQGISRPMYGDQSGFVYLMDQATYNVAGTSFLGEFQTAYTDFGQVDHSLSGKNKIFDFLEVDYVPTGNNDFYIGVYVDGSLRQTLTFSQVLGVALDTFVLDVDSLVGEPTGKQNRKQLKSCIGKKISFRVYNNNSNEAFQIERLVISFRLSAEQIYSGQV